LRAYLGDAAELLRSESGLRLLPASALLVPDPRCAAPRLDRIRTGMNILPDNGGASQATISAAGIEPAFGVTGRFR
jgi:hypothetical protein